MSKVLLYRSRIVEAISRGSRQINGGTVCISRNYDTCKVLHRNHQLIWTNYLESNAFKVLTAGFHSSPQVRNDEPLEASREKNEDKQSPREFEEDGRGSGQQFEDEGREGDHEPVWDNSEPRGDGRESVIERLRRLSMTPADHYRLSPMAEEKARQMEQVRRETIQKGEQWKWDQRNIRPGGPGPQRGGYGGNRRDDYGGNFGNYGNNRGRGRYDEEDDYYEPEQRNRWSRNHQSTFEDRRMGPSFGDRQRAVREEDFDEVDESRDSYEEEMEKLRARLAANKEKLKAELEKRSKEGNAAERNVSSSSESFQEASVDGPSSLGNTQDPQANLKLALSDPDTFGNLSFSTSVLVKDRISEEIRNELLEEEKALSPLNEEEEEDDTRFIPPYGERWTNNKLVRKVRELLKEKKLKEAVDTFLGVLKQGGFQFDDNELRHHFNVLINECAAVGYVEMAFRLFNLMKKRGYKENCRTISSLLNACANSPWDKENNIDRIDKLLINMKDRGRTPNLINYHAMIKAYGRLGETVRAFHVVDKMIEESDIKPVTETYNMLLQACISDTKNGFRYTLITWRKMWSTKKVRPDIYSFNLLLRAVRDCGIELTDLELEEGKLDSSNKQLQKRLNSGEAVLPPIVTQGDSNKVLDFLIPENTAPREGQLLLENLGEPTALDVKVLMKALQYPSNRLQVLGGLRGIISQMARCKVPPNLKTLTELVQVSSDIDIHDILQLLDTYKIKPDHAFFCVALKKLYGHDNHYLAKEVLKLMNNVYHLTPNLVIYSVMAQGCRSWKDAKELLAEMDETNFLPEIYVMGSLLGTAVRTCDPKYALHVLNETKRREIPVNEAFLLKIDNFIKATQRGVVGHEWGKPVENKDLVKALETNPDFGRDFGLLKMTYNTWIQTVDVKVYPENPWKAEWEYFKAHKKHRPVETDDLKYESMLNASSSSNS